MSFPPEAEKTFDETHAAGVSSLASVHLHNATSINCVFLEVDTDHSEKLKLHWIWQILSQ